MFKPLSYDLLSMYLLIVHFSAGREWPFKHVTSISTLWSFKGVLVFSQITPQPTAVRAREWRLPPLILCYQRVLCYRCFTKSDNYMLTSFCLEDFKDSTTSQTEDFPANPDFPGYNISEQMQKLKQIGTFSLGGKN